MARRLEARLARRFPDADQAQEELIAMGVAINDKRRTWRFQAPKVAGSLIQPDEPRGALMSSDALTLTHRLGVELR